MRKKALIFFIILLLGVKVSAQDKIWSVEIGSWGDSVMASTTYEHNLFNRLYVGAGLGLTWNFAYPISYYDGNKHVTYPSRLLVPIYANVKYYFGQKKIRPFVDLKGGFLSDYTHMDVGFFVRPAFGLQIKKIGVNIGFEYNNLKGSPSAFDKGDTFLRGYLGISYSL